MKTEVITVRLTWEEKTFLRRYADFKTLSMSEVLRDYVKELMNEKK